jgi:hypothetical protein
MSSAKVIAYVNNRPAYDELSLLLNIQYPIAVILIKKVIKASL